MKYIAFILVLFLACNTPTSISEPEKDVVIEEQKFTCQNAHDIRAAIHYERRTLENRVNEGDREQYVVITLLLEELDRLEKGMIFFEKKNSCPHKLDI